MALGIGARHFATAAPDQTLYGQTLSGQTLSDNINQHQHNVHAGVLLGTFHQPGQTLSDNVHQHQHNVHALMKEPFLVLLHG